MSVVRHRDIPSKYWITKITKQRVGKEGKEVHNRFTATPAPAASEVCYSALFSLWSMELQGKPDRLSYLPSQTDIDIYIYIYTCGIPHTVYAHLCSLYRPTYRMNIIRLKNFVMQGQSYRITDESSLQIKGKSKTNSKLLKQSR